MLLYVSEIALLSVKPACSIWAKRENHKSETINCFSVEKEDGKYAGSYSCMPINNSSPRQFSDHAKTDKISCIEEVRNLSFV